LPFTGITGFQAPQFPDNFFARDFLEYVIQYMLIEIPKSCTRLSKISPASIAFYRAACANSARSAVGGWHNHLGQYAWFRADHTVGFGDRANEALARTSTWSDENRLSFSDGKTGSWKMLFKDSLEVFIENCGKQCAEKPMKFQRNNSFGCPE
jgi:hypothetical protein